MEDTKKTRLSKHNRSEYLNSQRLRKHAQGLYGSALDAVLELKREGDI